MDEDGLPGLDLVSDTESATEAKPARRTGQTESEFQSIQNTYRPKIQNGEIATVLELPLPENAHKQLVEDVEHAVEELYFFRRFDEAIGLIARIRASQAPDEMDAGLRKALDIYEERCAQRLKETKSS